MMYASSRPVPLWTAKSPNVEDPPIKGVLFDFDGTLIEADSFLMILKAAFTHQPWRLLLVPLLLPCGVFYMIWQSLVDGFGLRDVLKSFCLYVITVGKTHRASVVDLLQWARPVLKTAFAQPLAIIQAYRATGHHIFYVSASGQLWLRFLLNQWDHGEKYIIGTHLKFGPFGGVVLKSPNCYGHQKVLRIQNTIKTLFKNNKPVHWVSGYSDHIADMPMLQLCDQCFLISPKHKHLAHFLKSPLKDRLQIYKWSRS